MKRRLSLDSLLRLKSRPAPREPLPPLVKRIFALAFMSEFLVIYPFYVIMMGERGNVSAAGIGLLLAIWMVVAVLAEVPTGIIADKMSKKWSLVLGRIMQLATMTTWLLVPNFTGYLIGFVIWGIGEAFLSGAFQAYMYESLDADKKKVFGKIYSRASAFTMMAYMAAGALAFVIGPNYPMLLVVSMLVSAMSLGITLSLPDTRRTAQVEVEVRPKILATALGAIRGNVVLRRILVAAVIIQGLVGLVAEYLPAYYYQVGTPAQWVALVISIGSAAAALLYWWMHRVEAQLTRYQPFIIIGFTLLFALSFTGGVLVAVLGMFVFSRMLRTMAVHNETQIQHHAPDEARATLGSLYSFVGKLLSAGLVALAGLLAVDNKIVVPLRWAAIGMVAAFALCAVYFRLRPVRR